MMSNLRVCNHCKGPSYQCRKCGKLTCEHFCGNKVDTGLKLVEATCTSCLVRRALLRLGDA